MTAEGPGVGCRLYYARTALSWVPKARSSLEATMSSLDGEDSVDAYACAAWRFVKRMPCSDHIVERTPWPVYVKFMGGKPADNMGTGLYGAMVVSRRLCDDLRTRFAGFGCLPVQLLDPKVRTEEQMRLSRSDDVYFGLDWKKCKTYHGPELCELSPELVFEVEDYRSDNLPIVACPDCGSLSISTGSLDGVQKLWPEEGVFLSEREPGSGLLMPKSQLEGKHFFRFGECWYMFSEPAAEFCMERGYTNLRFLEWGEVVEG